MPLPCHAPALPLPALLSGCLRLDPLLPKNFSARGRYVDAGHFGAPLPARFLAGQARAFYAQSPFIPLPASPCIRARWHAVVSDFSGCVARPCLSLRFNPAQGLITGTVKPLPGQ